MKRHAYLAALAVAAAITIHSAVDAQRKGPKSRRAAPPEFGDEVGDVFFSDARERLVGERPNFGSLAPRGVTGGPTPPGGGTPASTGGVFGWSGIISATTVEDEIKAIKMQVDEVVTTPGPFKGGGFRKARKQFSTLAVMFAIAGEYDGDIRWKENAPGLRDAFARAGFNCKVGTDGSYNEAKLRRDDLEGLIRGQKVDVKDAETKATWDKVSNRSPIMQRMEEGFQKRLKPWLANAGEFKNNSEKVYHEAQVLAALAETIQREGYEYWDDEDYAGYAKTMEQAAIDIAEAVKLNSYDNANKAASEISKACSECHEGYRS
jgi:cytochrome c556